MWTKGRHTTKYGFTYYHFDLNHFQPSGGGGLLNPRGAFLFQGQMTTNVASGNTSYNALADFLLGLPNNGTGRLRASCCSSTTPIPCAGRNMAAMPRTSGL